MKAKSAVLSSKRPPPADKPANGKRRPTARLPAAERKAQIQAKAFEFFSEYGLTAQTRALAEACGVSQRLLYSAFPNKAALINAVYEAEIAGPFKAIWFVQLRDRKVPLADRLNNFYGEYYDTILTRRWLRLFLYASLAEERPQTQANYVEKTSKGHNGSGAIRITSSTALDSRSHWANSFCNCVRPALVRV